jgi:CysZ protein
MSDLLAGVSYPLRALGMINRNPRLWRYVVVPILVNLAVGAVLYLGIYVGALRALEAQFGGAAESGLGAVFFWVVQALLAVTLAVGIGFVLVRFGVVLGSPWYGQLSEELENMLTGRTRPAHKLSAGEILGDIGRALQFEGKKLLLVLAIWLPSLLLLLIPAAGGLLYAGIGIALGATIACLDFFDGPLERRRLGFRQKLGTVRRLLPGSASFGLVAFGLVSIPVLNLLAIPLCVAAGNILVIEHGLAERVANQGSTEATEIA